ncbi:MAG: alpha-ketoglutarate-dependent dioxygenase AlkB [Myxococcota bacterium]
MHARQPSLFGWEEPSVDPRFGTARRLELSPGAWVDRVPGWVQGHERLFEALRDGIAWHASQREMYERMVDVPRLFARVPDDGTGHPVLEQMRHALCRRYRRDLSQVTLSLYRDGRDSVAWHRDREVRELDDSVVAVVSLGGPRKFGLRPFGGGHARYFTVGWGDLVVMGGACQRDWEHGVPKMRAAAPRLAVMFRPEGSGA